MKRSRSTSIVEFQRRFPDENACHRYVARVCFGDPPRCPNCTIKNELHPYKKPRQLFCRHCQSVISPTAGRIFSNSIIPLRTWFYFLLLMANRTTGLSTDFVARHLGITRPAAFRILSVLRLHMAALSPPRRIGGNGAVVQVDETWLPSVKSSSSRMGSGAIIFGLYDQNGVQTRIVPNRRSETLIPLIEALVEPGSTIVSDQHKGYDSLSERGFRHIRLNHARAEWVNSDGYSMLGIEGYWGNFKYFMRSNNRNPKEFCLPGYLSEHAFRYNCRKQKICPFESLIEKFPIIDRSLLPPGALRSNKSKILQGVAD